MLASIRSAGPRDTTPAAPSRPGSTDADNGDEGEGQGGCTGLQPVKEDSQEGEMSILGRKESHSGALTPPTSYTKTSAQPFRIFLSTSSQSLHRHPATFLSSASSSSKCTADTRHYSFASNLFNYLVPTVSLIEA